MWPGRTEIGLTYNYSSKVPDLLLVTSHSRIPDKLGNEWVYDAGGNWLSELDQYDKEQL